MGMRAGVGGTGTGAVRSVEDEIGKEYMTFGKVYMTRWSPWGNDAARVWRRLITAGVLSTGCLAGAACDGDGGAVTPDPPRAASLSVSPESATLSSLGDTVTITATIRDQSGALFSGTVAWASSHPGVASVAPDGLVTAAGNGTATVTATHQRLSATVSVVVAQEAAALAVAGGGGQKGLPGRELSEPVAVLVEDAGGAAVAGVTVTFAAAEGNGSASPASVESDADGIARTMWILGGQRGSQRLLASAGAGVTVEIEATAVLRLPLVPVCDRSPAVREALVRLAGRPGCDVVSAGDLAGIDTLDLGGAGIESVRTGDFSGLDSLLVLNLSGNRIGQMPGTAFSGLSLLQSLDLTGNRMESLPGAIFAGLASLAALRLAGNPGAPFIIQLELLRTDTTRLGTAGPASVALAAAEGAPFPVTLPLVVENGTASGTGLLLDTGETLGGPITVEGPAADSGATRLASGMLPAVPAGFDGLELRASAPLSLFDPAANTATYRVVFDATWSASTHPADFPPGPHFSPLVGAVHNGGATFWALGDTATRGIEIMAETGGTGTLTAEIRAAIPDHALAVVNGRGIGSPGSATIQGVGVREDFPLVTLVTMIAPSPDWFVGVAGLSLLMDDGRWVDELQVVLYPLDSGTDSGTTYRSANRNTSPRQPIRSLKGVSPFSDAPIGTFTFTRIAGSAVR